MVEKLYTTVFLSICDSSESCSNKLRKNGVTISAVFVSADLRRNRSNRCLHFPIPSLRSAA